MKLAALLALSLVFVPPSTAAAPPQLGIDRDGPNSSLAWLDPSTLQVLPRPVVQLGSHVGSWSRSPDGVQLAIAQSNGANVRFVDLRRMRMTADFDLSIGGAARGLIWTRPDRLLAFTEHPQGAMVIAFDLVRRKVIRRTVLGGRVAASDRFAGGLVLLLEPDNGIGPARLAVVDPDGQVRIAPLEIQIGARIDSGSPAPSTQRQAGLALDRGSRTAYVVDAERIAVVPIDSLAVSYRAQPRQLAKSIEGPVRLARRLGNGLIAVGGEPDYGVRLLDVRDWTTRMLDPGAVSFDLGHGLVIVRTGDTVVAYGADGSRRFAIALPPEAWLNADGGRYAAVCRLRSSLAVVDLATGSIVPAGKGSRCADLLMGRWSAT